MCVAAWCVECLCVFARIVERVCWVVGLVVRVVVLARVISCAKSVYVLCLCACVFAGVLAALCLHGWLCCLCVCVWLSSCVFACMVVGVFVGVVGCVLAWLFM